MRPPTATFADGRSPNDRLRRRGSAGGHQITDPCQTGQRRRWHDVEPDDLARPRVIAARCFPWRAPTAIPRSAMMFLRAPPIWCRRHRRWCRGGSTRCSARCKATAHGRVAARDDGGGIRRSRWPVGSRDHHDLRRLGTGHRDRPGSSASRVPNSMPLGQTDQGRIRQQGAHRSRLARMVCAGPPNSTVDAPKCLLGICGGMNARW